MNDLLLEYNNIPPITRVYTTACVVTTVAVQLEVLTPFQLYFNPTLIFKNFQIWRLVTNFCFFGTVGFNFLFNMIFNYRYCRMLEENSFRGRSADFFIMFLFGGFFMTIAGIFVNMAFLGQAFTIMIVYVWSRRNTFVRMNFFGLLTFQAPYLPWVLLAFSFLLGNHVIVDLLGIIVGHLYFFLEDVFPRQQNGFKVLKTPVILVRLNMENIDSFDDNSTNNGTIGITTNRMKGVMVVKPFLYGNVARYFGRKREEDGHTHQWTVFVKPYLNEDMSVYVKKVHFKLHESYSNPNRVLTKPPFEITETGWGEFEIQFKLYFADTTERPVQLYHVLKLFQHDSQIIMGHKELYAEHYDEIIFQEPSIIMHRLLTSSNRNSVSAVCRHDVDYETEKRRAIELVASAKKRVNKDIAEVRDQLKRRREAINQLKAINNRLEIEAAATANL